MMRKNPVHRYLDKLAYPAMPHDQLPAPHDDLKLVIVIPCLAELDHIDMTLASLLENSRRLREVEILVVVNHGANASHDVMVNNRKTIEKLRAWQSQSSTLHIIDRASQNYHLESKMAGVGLARRIGMDIALRRLTQVGNIHQSAIACLDGDVTVSAGYSDQILSLFAREGQPIAGICRFAHPLPADDKQQEAIVFYELWLRYLERGLALTGTPFAYHSIGSCIVVSAIGYALADGMPCRQAAEDFHFLQKIAKIGRRKKIQNIEEVTVYPSARASLRVPFGTGRAMTQALQQGSQLYRQVVSPSAFFQLKYFFSAFTKSMTDLKLLKEAASPAIEQFINNNSGWEIFEQFQRNYNQIHDLELACHHWFDGLKIIRFLNQQRKEHALDILAALPQLLLDTAPDRLQGNHELDLVQGRQWLNWMRQQPW